MPEIMTNRDFAAERSHQNARVGYDHAKAVAQATILINGGAATAVLAFLSGANGAMLLHFAPYCLMLYSVAVSLGAFTMWALFQSNHHWNIFWQSLALHEQEDVTAKASAERWRARAHTSFIATIGCFVVASLGLGLGFLWAK
jgi:hypothetical protein